MKEYQLFVGLEDQHAKRQLIETHEALDFIAQTLVNAGIDGATFTQGKGLYRYKDGKVGYENSIICSMLDFEGNLGQTIEAIVPLIKERLNQQSVALKWYDVESILL